MHTIARVAPSGLTDKTTLAVNIAASFDHARSLAPLPLLLSSSALWAASMIAASAGHGIAA